LSIEYQYGIIRCTEYRSNKQIPTRWSFILINICLLFNYLFVNLILEEKNEIFQIINIKPIVNYLIWSLIYLIILEMNCLFCLILFKISLNNWIIFKSMSSLILLITFSLLNLQLISYSILIGRLFNHSFLINIFSFIFFVIISFKEFNQILFFLNPYYSFIYLFRYLFLYERSMMDIHHKLFQWTPSLFKIYFIQIISIIIYWILIWYFDQIYPGLEFILFRE